MRYCEMVSVRELKNIIKNLRHTPAFHMYKARQSPRFTQLLLLTSSYLFAKRQRLTMSQRAKTEKDWGLKAGGLERVLSNYQGAGVNFVTLNLFCPDARTTMHERSCWRYTEISSPYAGLAKRAACRVSLSFFLSKHTQLAVNRDDESEATGDSGGVLLLGAFVCSGRINYIEK